MLKTFPAALLERLVGCSILSVDGGDVEADRRASTESNREKPGCCVDAQCCCLDLIASRCTELESGGRMIDAILTRTLLPGVSGKILTRLDRRRGRLDDPLGSSEFELQLPAQLKNEGHS